jgi:hypothetical protein
MYRCHNFRRPHLVPPTAHQLPAFDSMGTTSRNYTIYFFTTEWQNPLVDAQPANTLPRTAMLTVFATQLSKFDGGLLEGTFPAASMAEPTTFCRSKLGQRPRLAVG